MSSHNVKLCLYVCVVCSTISSGLPSLSWSFLFKVIVQHHTDHMHVAYQVGELLALTLPIWNTFPCSVPFSYCFGVSLPYLESSPSQVSWGFLASALQTPQNQGRSFYPCFPLLLLTSELSMSPAFYPPRLLSSVSEAYLTGASLWSRILCQVQDTFLLELTNKQRYLLTKENGGNKASFWGLARGDTLSQLTRSVWSICCLQIMWPKQLCPGCVLCLRAGTVCPEVRTLLNKYRLDLQPKFSHSICHGLILAARQFMEAKCSCCFAREYIFDNSERNALCVCTVLISKRLLVDLVN